MPPLASIEEIYYKIHLGCETELLRDDLRTLFTHHGMSYHEPGKENQMFRKPKMMEHLTLLFDEIRTAFTMLMLEEASSRLV